MDDGIGEQPGHCHASHRAAARGSGSDHGGGPDDLGLVSAYNSRLIKRPFNALIQRIVSYDGSRSTAVAGFEHAPQELAVIRTRFEEMADHMND